MNIIDSVIDDVRLLDVSGWSSEISMVGKLEGAYSRTLFCFEQSVVELFYIVVEFVAVPPLNNGMGLLFLRCFVRVSY